MSGRKQFDVDEALDRAMTVFWARGYADASLDVLGKATGLGRGSLYGAFGDKDQLFRQALDRYSATYGIRSDAALAAHADDPVRAVEAFFDATLDRIADPDVPDGCLVAQSVAHSATLTPESAVHVESLVRRQFRRVRAALDPLPGSPSELDDLARYVVAVTQSLAVMSRAGTDATGLRSIARLACGTVAAAANR